MADSPRGVPGPDLTDAPADIEAAVNPLRDWVNDHPGISDLTTAERDALTGVDLWTGRLIYNTTTDRYERYDAGWAAAFATISGATISGSVLAAYDELLDDKGNVSGAVTLDFATHNAWRINPTGGVVITFSNLPAAGYLTPGTIIVGNSTYAITWPAGTKFPNGEPPELDGETWLSVAARSTHVTVGAAWPAVAT